MRASKPEVLEAIVSEGKLTDAIKAELDAALESFSAQFSKSE